MALMILVNNPGSWAHIYSPLEHAPWHGCTPTDLVFPFFLFAVGNALAFVIPKLKIAGTQVFLKKVFKRALLIFAIGLFLNWSPFIKWQDDQLVFKTWDTIRIFGVLQRIALSYLFAALIVYLFKTKRIVIISAIILLLYWLLSYVFGESGDPYSLSGFFGTEVDLNVLGPSHMYKGEGVAFDPEGIVSTLTSIVQVVLGYLVGKYIKNNGSTATLKNNDGDTITVQPYALLTHLFIAGCLLVFAGYAWDFLFPINKKIWTSSYVLYTTGLAIVVLSLLIYTIEFKNKRGAWSRFFDVFGKNALFIFFLSGFLPRIVALFRWLDHYDEQGKPVYTSPLPWFYQYVCKPLFNDPKNSSLLYAIVMIIFYWFMCYLLDKKKIYIKV